MSAGSSSVELNFSFQAKIHSLERNRLTSERGEQFLAIKYNGRLLLEGPLFNANSCDVTPEDTVSSGD